MALGGPRGSERVRKGPQGSLRGSERVPKGAQKGPQGASEGHLEFVCFLGAFLEGKMFKHGAFFVSKMRQNLSNTEKGEKPIRAYPHMKNLFLRVAGCQNHPKKVSKKCADFRLGVLPLFNHFGDPLWTQNAPKMS